MAGKVGNMNVNYEYYRTFYYVAKYGNFTKAANALCSNQPNVTRTIHKLEDQLGCRLFIRSNRGVALTPEGEKLFGHIEIAQEHIQQGENELAGNTELQTGNISIGASETALNLFLLEKLSLFHERYPGIRLRIFNHSTPQALSALKRGVADLAVVTTPVIAEKPLKTVPLMAFQEILVCGKHFRSLAEKTLSLKNLNEYPLVMLGRDTMTYTFYDQIFLQHGLALQADTEVATTDQLLPMIRANLGIGFLPERMAQEALARGDIYQITLREKIPLRYVTLVCDSRRPLSIAAKEFERLLKTS